MDTLFFVIGILGGVISLIVLLIYSIKKKPKKNPLIALGICIALFVTSFVIYDSNEGLDDNAVDSEPGNTDEAIKEGNQDTKLTQEETELLKRSYKDFDSKERTAYAVILEKMDKINDGEVKNEFQQEIDRLEREKEIWVQEQKEEENKPENRKIVLERAIKARIDDGDYKRVKLDKITINDNLGTDIEDDYIALVYLKFEVKNSKKTGNNMMRMYSDDLSATLANKGIEDVAEIAVFWEDEYNKRDLKYAYEYRDGGFFIMDIAGE